MSSKMFLKETVIEAARQRIAWLFDEFETVIVNFSGGKDSTIVYNLALEVARAKGRLPLPVFFIDQEGEWQSVIDYIRAVMNNPDVQPLWLQCPIKILNATSPFSPWLHCWEPGAEWMRDREPNSIHENTYGTDRFGKLFEAFLSAEYADQRVARIAGVRCEESPARWWGLTRGNVYKGVTWGAPENRKLQHYVFYPVYDWSYTDVWKAIHEHGWDYCPLYDAMYQYGMPVRKMRVSNVHHESAVGTLEYLQDIEGETWNRLTKRLAGVNAVAQMQGDWFMPSELPRMFADWREYRDHLLKNLVPAGELQDGLLHKFALGERSIADEYHDELHRLHIHMILVQDFEGTKWTTWIAGNAAKQRCRQLPPQE